MQAETRILASLARAFTGRDYLAANQVRHYAYDIVKEIFESVDIIVSPTTGITAPLYNADVFPFGESDVATTTRLMRFVVALPMRVPFSSYLRW